MTIITPDTKPAAVPGSGSVLLAYLKRDKLALAAAIFLAIVVIAAALGPWLVGDAASRLGLRQRNLAPFALASGWIYVLGADTLGRPILARLIVGAQNTFGIAAAAVFASMLVGGTLGLIAGYSERWYSHLILRLADVVMSFPSLLLALIVLYTLGPSITNLVIVLAVTRMPIYLRTARAEVLELRERMFVSAARAMGAKPTRIIVRHIAPLVLPTLVTISAIDFATVILSESALSFLGLGIQPPDFTWGAMVANGRGYLATAWWIAFWPGLAIMLTTLSLNILSNWARTVADPQQRWRLQTLRKAAR
ncbi:MAG: ABC transporter permease [Mesorhizobium sp.]|uniref:ABC transporter permease n=1 Tax=Mesorhizobium sp. TaxID=1871066 RepID=UPI000FE770A8|nr:ABC transporter permease [Mesorhizobium sp.]RWH84435.1 MAG: ABC transporter permease [Mesorhizobium sp.]RWH86821.1 MAG: ABC transporter permease [Mesorhizobium sp.]RWH93642.1 MAG: ABC transporter permease [Mesorhizobium sp.]RWI02901.1 MAG: ABC transporter permease [Mesorhizobium sp.]RWI05412.1 MAG: ABC transporter permease [Mesorhizobium sp.]